ncbi:tryptase [Astyanax mexicanus]|uniref:tryptase n=1 Tax=Astyanax mexicanus TaxID=7994 RepID=UPI0020CB1C07|nr:tryptase [Astyanax mexicanus]
MELHWWKAGLVVLAVLLNATGSLSQSACGQAPLNTKIVGGNTAVSGSWPWQVSIQSLGRHFCGGSLINNNWILSAAHCFQSSQTSTLAFLRVSLGKQSLQTPESNSLTITVAQIINHPSYVSSAHDNDIALLQLSSSVTFSDYIQPVCLAAAGSTLGSGTLVWVTGWGDISSDVSLPDPQNLQEVELPIVSNTACTSAYGSGSITSNMMCAGLSQGGKDSCQGDSGGPLVIKQSTGWTQAGIVSFGYGCALPKIPGVYARVSEYQNWINSRIGSSQPGYVTVTASGGSRIFSQSLSLSLCIVPFLLSLYIF